jgi:hypothetical protein
VTHFHPTWIPDPVTVGPHAIEVRHDSDTAQLLRSDGMRGDSRPDELLVRLDSDRPHTAVAETLLHELIHIAWHQTPLRCSDLDDHEEPIVSALAPVLLGVLRANPQLVAYLTAAPHTDRELLDH